MSESDYPLEVVRWEGVAEPAPEFLRGLTKNYRRINFALSPGREVAAPRDVCVVLLSRALDCHAQSIDTPNPERELKTRASESNAADSSLPRPVPPPKGNRELPCRFYSSPPPTLSRRRL